MDYYVTINSLCDPCAPLPWSGELVATSKQEAPDKFAGALLVQNPHEYYITMYMMYIYMYIYIRSQAPRAHEFK